MSLLPEKLVRGRAYFVDDEQVIVVDHGKGPVIYGGKPGPQGQAGEPLPQLQDQIDKLAEAELQTQSNIWRLTERSDKKIENVQDNVNLLEESTTQKFLETFTRITQEAQIAKDYTDALSAQTAQRFQETEELITQEVQSAKDYTDELSARTAQKFRETEEFITRESQASRDYTDALETKHVTDINHIATLLNDTDDRMQSQVDSHTTALLSFLLTVQEKFSSYDNALAIITKTISNLYPSPYAEEAADPLDGETLSTDAGSWTIQQTNLDDGTIMLELEAQTLLIEALQIGDKVDYDGATWTVSNYSVDEGMISIELTP